MADSAEAVCQEFARNFQALELKYTALSQQLEQEKHTTTQVQRELVNTKGALDESEQEVIKLKKDLEEGSQFKDLYSGTMLAMESLKGRLESARKALSDRDMEHKNETDQLRSQIKDLLRRVEVSSDAPLLHALRSQKGELEERCAISNGQLLEERERTNQQLSTANGTLRDSQSRCVELEQRCRALESEVTSMRSNVRHYDQACNDAVLERERMALENARLQTQIHSRDAELANLHTKMEDHESTMTLQRLEHQRSVDHEVSVLSAKLREKDIRVEEALSQRAADAEKHHQLQRTIQGKVQAVREESSVELDRRQQEVDQLRESLAEVSAKLRGAQGDLHEVRRLQQETDLRLDTAERARHAIQMHLDEAQQATTWSNAERDRANQTIQRMQSELDGANQQNVAHASAQLDLERLKLQLHYTGTELMEAKKQLEGEGYKQATIVKTYEGKLAEQSKELRDTRKDYKNSLTRLEKHKRKLMMHVTEKEHEIATMMAMPGTYSNHSHSKSMLSAAALSGGGRGAAGGTLPHVAAPTSTAELRNEVTVVGGMDTMALMMAQRIQADDARRALGELTKGSTVL